jgi:DNA (cytosine-5)-methyltransferase 1
LRVLGYLEREAFAASVLMARMEDEILESAPIFCGNMEDFDASPFAGVDLVTAGIPCQPYSPAGKQLGDEDERALWPEFIRIVSECRPSVVFLENVPTFVTGGWFRRPGEELSRLGYRIERPLFLAASDLGTTHERERVWVLAHRNPDGFKGERCGGIFDGERAAQRHDPDRCSGADVADSEGLREREPNHEASSKSWKEPRLDLGGRSSNLANPQRNSLRKQEQRGQGAAQETKCRKPELRHNGPNLEHAEQFDGRQGSLEPFGFQPPFTWPPGPSDWEAWLEVGQALEPAVCLVADGAPDWMDAARYPTEQLRCLGNSVVPQVAGFAFAVLAREAGLI